MHFAQTLNSLAGFLGFSSAQLGVTIFLGARTHGSGLNGPMTVSIPVLLESIEKKLTAVFSNPLNALQIWGSPKAIMPFQHQTSLHGLKCLTDPFSSGNHGDHGTVRGIHKELIQFKELTSESEVESDISDYEGCLFFFLC